MSECELVKRIDVLKESESVIRAERQKLEEKARRMICERLLIRGAED